MGDEDVAICLLCQEATEEVAGCKCGGTMGIHLRCLALWCHSRTTAYIGQVDTINRRQPEILETLNTCELCAHWTYCQTCKEPFGFHQSSDLADIFEEMRRDPEKYPDIKPLPAHVGKILSLILYCNAAIQVAKKRDDKDGEKMCFEFAAGSAFELWEKLMHLKDDVHPKVNLRRAFDQCNALIEYAEDGVKHASSD